MKTLLFLLLTIAFMGCSHVHVQRCPDGVEGTDIYEYENLCKDAIIWWWE